MTRLPLRLLMDHPLQGMTPKTTVRFDTRPRRSGKDVFWCSEVPKEHARARIPLQPPQLCLLSGCHYLISTRAPMTSNFLLIVGAFSLLTPSFTVFGAPSTRSLASFKPRLVTSRTALITLILFAPTSGSTTA